ncbi:MAG TPA: TadE/TadG family type IV pilus assembly protein [Pyrinomonadaceae bacterium]|jgi:Flp pilus assembly protein TadG|nr:TadE/TadG family type IV pilus assembly protein [Pyrinomonadaceae bacterium]
MLFSRRRRNERGASLLELSIVASIFFTSLFGVLEFGRLLWTHNTLRDAARRGARYAVVRKNDAAGIAAVKNMVVYGDPNANPATAIPVAAGLTPSNVQVDYVNFNGIQLSARASISIINYQFKFSVPLVGGTLNMPAYRTSQTGESAGYIPCDIPSGTPYAPCNIVPN